MKNLLICVATVCLLLSSCGTDTTPIPTSTSSITPSATPSVTIRESVTKSVYLSATPSAVISESATATVFPSATSQPLSVSISATPSDWKNWPIVPAFIDPSLRNVYERGLSLGNNPQSFSVFGDCQTRPGEFFGIFETDETATQNLSPELQETVAYFNGSFNREASTVQDGTTPGALLWTQWHRGEFGCTFAETPVECEIRTHRPSFVIIQVGTHFESRNTEYLRRIINQLLDAGIIPILATKADNREKDERINRDMALLASEYDLPLWNFWAAVSDLPNRGLYTRKDRPLQGDIYLTEEASLRHRMTGLETLNAVWRGVALNKK